MATIQMSDQLCNVVYVDAGIGSPGDGSTPALAIKVFPVIGSLPDNTVYLIRRNITTAINIPTGQKSHINHCYFIGMPLSTDWLYERIPAEAKTAWDADVPVYARINFPAYNSYAQFLDVDDMGWHRILFVRMDPNSGYGIVTTNSMPNLYLNGATTGTDPYDGSWFFTNNKWMDDGYDLDNDSFTTTCQGGGFCVGFANGRSLKMTDNTFLLTNSSNSYWQGWGWYNHIDAQNIQDVDFTNNQIWALDQQTYSTEYYITYLNNITRLICCNNSIKWIIQNKTAGGASPNMGLYIGYGFHFQSREAYIRDITVTTHRYYNRSNFSSGSASFVKRQIYYHNWYGDATGGNPKQSANHYFDIDNLSVNMGDVWRVSDSNDLLQINAASGGGGNNQYLTQTPLNKCNNLTARVVNTGGIGSPNTAGNSYAMNLYLDEDVGTVNNIIAYNYKDMSIAIYTRDYDRGPVYKNVLLEGGMYAARSPMVEVVSISSPKANTAGLIQSIYCNIYIQNATFNRSGWDTAAWLYYNGGAWNNTIIIDNVNLPTFINWQDTPAYQSGVYINNVDGVTGNWYGSNRYYIAQSWNAYRTGGANAALKITGTYSNERVPLYIGNRPFKGLQWIPTSTGMAKAVFYIAQKNYSGGDYSLRPKRIKATVEVPYVVGSETRYKLWTSDVHGKWTTDGTSTWVNDSGLNQAMCEVPFMVENNTLPVIFRLQFDWYDSLGYTYFDPLINFSMM